MSVDNIGIRSEALIKQVLSYDKSSYAQYLRKAILFSQKAHELQMRNSGEPFFHHPLEVAKILADMKLDSLSIIVALLHDTVEDTNITLQKISSQFSDKVAELVDGVTKIGKISRKSQEVVQAENLRKFIIAMSKDIRVLIVKLADRLHNMRTLEHISSIDKRNKISLETLEIYAPLAERIGMQKIKNELQDLAFSNLYSDVRSSIKTRMNLLKENDQSLIDKIIFELSTLMEKHSLKCKIVGREKSPYSIWSKMKRKSINFEQLSDVIAFRIVVSNIDNCYRVLGLIHTHYHSIPGSFKDFISTPKKNGYKSLHTIVIGPELYKIEVQIRTQDMNKISEIGVAAHWCYKQGAEELEKNKYNWIAELLQILETSSDSSELLENTKLEMYYDQVFCFTPKGQVIALPKGACVIDFAYAVHSDIGDSCVGAKVNSRPIPLKTMLENGDQVEIITNKNHKPPATWEKFVTTGKALSAIRKQLRKGMLNEYINLGRVIVSQILEQHKMKFSEDTLRDTVDFFHKPNVDSLLAAVGEGHVSQDQIIKRLIPEKHQSVINRKFSLFKPNKKNKTGSKISIKGLIPGLAVHFAPCCNPIPGDSIVGIQQTGKGITVHVLDCEILQNYSSTPEKWLDITWDKNPEKDIYKAIINAVVLNKPGSLAMLAVEVAKLDANVTNFKIMSRSKDFFEILVDLEVKGLNHLTNIITILRTKSCIQSACRYIRDE